MAAAHVLDYVLYAVMMALGVAQGIYVSCRKRHGHDVSREAFLGDRSLGVLPLAVSVLVSTGLATRTGGPDRRTSTPTVCTSPGTCSSLWRQYRSSCTALCPSSTGSASPPSSRQALSRASRVQRGPRAFG
ncbi:hypothetical protein MRX96_059455 [Rhipicephalus microplus]